jgi:ribosome-binding protein aMBF1 (putative translation factor)
MGLETNPPLSGEWGAGNYTIPSFKFPDPVPCQYCGSQARGEVIRIRSEATSQTMHVCVSCIIDLIELAHELRDEKRGGQNERMDKRER